MVNAQEYINQKYPNKANTFEINENNQNLEGDLIIKDFPNLKKIECRNNKGLVSIKLVNLPKLDYFHGNNCFLKKIVISNCPNIAFFNVANNALLETEFLDGLNFEKLEVLSLHTNDLPKQGLEVFRKFSNLEQLFLDNCDEDRFKKGNYNKFTGSLKPLQNLTKLELLSIGNTDIDSGLEYLPASVRKIGLNTSWWELDTRCSKLRQELEKSVQNKEVKEKLKSEREKNAKGEEDPAWFSDYYRLAPWREVQQLGKENEAQNAQKWLDKNYPKETRNGVVFLNINGKNLEGELDLNDFVKVEKIDCSFNQLVNLNLSKCENLTHLNCSWNNFADIDFLKTIPNKGKLNILRINNNEKIKESLEWVKRFEGITSLNLESCAFFGSLEPLRWLDSLKKLFISRTHINEGLEYLPDNCKELYCDYDSKYKSMKFAGELSKFAEEGYYNLDKWRADKADNTTSSVIPLERLFVIRSNLKKYVDKWGIKEENDNNPESKGKLSRGVTFLTWPYQKISKWWKKEEVLLSELSNLKNPTEASWQWWANTTAQWTNRAALVAGGSLVLVGQSDTTDPNSQVYTQTGGIIAIVGPFVETLTSYINDQILEVRQAQWDDFVADTKNMLNNYHELVGILEQIEKKDLGKVNGTLNDLRKATKTFLDEYDKEDKENDIRKNGVIDINELTEDEARTKFAKNLSEEKKWAGASQLGRIVKMMKKLEEEIIDYRQEINTVTRGQDKEILLDNQKQAMAWTIVDLLNDYSNSAFNLETEYNQKGKENNYWNGKNDWKSYLEKEINNGEEFAEKKINLLLPLVEVIAKQLEKTNVDAHSEELKWVEFIKKTSDFCDTFQEVKTLENEEIKTMFNSLKKRVGELQKSLVEHNSKVAEKTAIAVKIEEEKELKVIVETIKKLDKKLETLYAKLTNNESGEREEQTSGEQITRDAIEAEERGINEYFVKKDALEQEQAEKEKLMAQVEVSSKHK